MIAVTLALQYVLAVIRPSAARKFLESVYARSESGTSAVGRKMYVPQLESNKIFTS